jgi:peptide/nickel transport system permease protein
LATYLAKRLLLMIPTTIGISLVLWVILVSAPGRPGSGGQSFGEEVSAADPTKELAKGESQYLFRRHFALDRPVVWNSWTSLDSDDVARAVREESPKLGKVEPRVRRLAKERLEDWGTYAVPGLIDRIAATTGVEQDETLKWLRLSATRRTEIPHDSEAEARNRAIVQENVEIARWKWEPADGPEKRADAVAKWKAWFAEKHERWSWSGPQKLWVALTDTQFGTWWGRLFRGDLGESHQYRRPVLELIVERLPVTLTLSLLSILLAYVLAIPLGIYSAVRPYTVTDRTITVGLFLLYSLPTFFVGTVLIRTLTVNDPFGWFPTAGFSSSGSDRWNTWRRLGDTLHHITLPLVVMTYGSLAGVSRFARTGMLDVIRSDYVRTARAKGLGERDVILRHAARNGMMPIVTLLGSLLPALIGGSVIVEFIFNLNGLGLLAIEAIGQRDYNIVVGEALLVAILTQVGILLADLLYAVLDPRISYA